MLREAEAREDPAAGGRPAERLPSASPVAVEAAMRGTAGARGPAVTEPLRSARPVEDRAADVLTLGASAVETLAAEAVHSSAAVVISVAALATAALVTGSAIAAKSLRIGLRLVTGQASAAGRTLAVAAQAPRLFHPIDLTSAEGASVTVLALEIGRASAAALILAGAKALLPTGQASATAPVLAIGRASAVTGLAWGRTWVHLAREPREQRSAAASPAVQASDRARSQA
jgi:hypothetical protein